MAKITEYPQATRFDANDVLLKDGTGGTKKIVFSDAAADMLGSLSPEMHRNVYRGKNLGSGNTIDDVFTAAQKTAISSGTFDDLFIGDYVTLGGKRYDIADMDYWYNCGDTAFTKHHLVMVPHVSLYNHVMNDTNTTEGGYVGSKMYTEGLDSAKATIAAAFGTMLLTHRESLINAVTDGHPSGYAWYDSDVELMSETMVYGHEIYSPMCNGTLLPTKYTIDKTQLAIFQLHPKLVMTARAYFWLRDVVSAAYFAFVRNYGVASNSGASYSNGVRPAFPVGIA